MNAGEQSNGAIRGSLLCDARDTDIAQRIERHPHKVGHVKVRILLSVLRGGQMESRRAHNPEK